jgi:CBS domain-containing protein
MLVADRMKQPVLIISPEVPIHEALRIMNRE